MNAPAIVTITFNPALDKSISVPELISDRKLKCAEPVFEPGGGGVNVARAIRKLGGTALAVYLAGGFTGAMMTELLGEEGVLSLPVGIKGLTRENLIIADEARGAQYLLDLPGPGVSGQEWQQCFNVLQTLKGVEYIVASGSLPPGAPADIFARAATMAKSKNAKFIVDTAGEPLRLALEAGVYLIKPNLRELALLAGRDVNDTEGLVDFCHHLIDEKKCEVIVVSRGSRGVLLIGGSGLLNVCPPPSLVESTVGAGDSLVAGIVYSLSKGINLVDAVRYGVACGTAATLNPGTELCRQSDVDRMLAGVSVASGYRDVVKI